MTQRSPTLEDGKARVEMMATTTQSVEKANARVAVRMATLEMASLT
jgi:hypothetical protein